MAAKKHLAQRLLSWVLKLQGFRSHIHKTKHAEIAYYTKRGRPGEPTLVFVHGIGAMSGHFYEIYPKLSKAGYGLLAIDLPGHGNSSELTDQMNVENLERTFVEVLSAVAPEKFILVGNSLGGALSLYYASEHPERVQGLLLASPAFGFESETEWQQLRGGLSVNSVDEARAFLDRLYYNKPFYVGLLPRPLLQSFNRKGVRELVATTRFEDVEVPADLKLYSGPLLVVWGKEDHFLPRSNVAKVRRLIHAGAVLEEPPAVGHCPQFDQPKWFGDRVIQFVKELN